MRYSKERLRVEDSIWEWPEQSLLSTQNSSSISIFPGEAGDWALGICLLESASLQQTVVDLCS